MGTIQGLQPQHTDWSRVPVEQLEPGVERQMIVGENLMICRLHIGPKVVTPPHDHPHEQMTIVEQGKVLFAVIEEIVAPSPVRIEPTSPCRASPGWRK